MPKKKEEPKVEVQVVEVPKNKSKEEIEAALAKKK